MKRLLISAVMIATLVATVAGFAATLGMGADDLAAGDALIAECDDSFGHTFTTSGGNVTKVIVDDIADLCGGGQLSLTITNSSGSSIGSGTATVSGSSVTVDISSTPDATTVKGIHIVVVGP